MVDIYIPVILTAEIPSPLMAYGITCPFRRCEKVVISQQAKGKYQNTTLFRIENTFSIQL
jgi:hypothetical protein